MSELEQRIGVLREDLAHSGNHNTTGITPSILESTFYVKNTISNTRISVEGSSLELGICTSIAKRKASNL